MRILVLSDSHGRTSAIEEALEALENAVFTSLRRVDVSTRYSSKQLLVILMDANCENGEIVDGDKIISICANALKSENRLKIHSAFMGTYHQRQILCCSHFKIYIGKGNNTKLGGLL